MSVRRRLRRPYAVQRKISHGLLVSYQRCFRPSLGSPRIKELTFYAKRNRRRAARAVAATPHGVDGEERAHYPF